MGLLGFGIVMFGITKTWSGFYKEGWGLFGDSGYELVAGQAALGFALFAAILLFVKPKLSAIPGILVLFCVVFAFLVPKQAHYSPQSGLYITALGSLLMIVSSLLVPIPHPRR